MKRIIFLFIICISLGAKAQLYVQPSGPSSDMPSYVFVNDTFVYVDQDIELQRNPNAEAEASIILRNEGQLLQGNGSDPLNKGTGDISIYQEGTSNAWDYNFWASPVGLAQSSPGVAAADGNGVFAFQAAPDRNVFYTPTTNVNSNRALISPTLNGASGTGFLSIAPFWIHSFNSGAGYANWNPIQDTGTLEAGFGFSMKGVNGTDMTDPGEGSVNNDGVLNNRTSGQRYDFRGRPNNGDINVSVGQDSFSLVGNPYPSALDLNYFLLENSGTGTFSATDINGNVTMVTRNDITTGTAYFWDSNPNVMSHFLESYQGGYATYVPDMGLNNSGTFVNATFYMYTEEGVQIPGGVGMDATFPTGGRRFAPVGQGFMVIGAADGNVVFKNDHRVFEQESALSSVFRNNEEEQEEASREVIGVKTYYPDATFPSTSTSRVKIGIGINDTYSRDLAITMLKKATSGYDIGGDGHLSGLPTDVSFVIEDQKGYVINAIPIDENEILPLAITAEGKTEFKFLAYQKENFKYDDVLLFDKLTQEYYDISSELIIKLAPGEYLGRFFIVFKKIEGHTKGKELSQPDNTEEIPEDITVDYSILESLTVKQNNPSAQLEIRNPRNTSLETLSLFDMSGKLILSKDQLGIQSIYSISTSRISTGIYIVQFTTDEGLTKSQKVSITNR